MSGTMQAVGVNPQRNAIREGQPVPANSARSPECPHRRHCRRGRSGQRGKSRRPRGWVIADGGYGWAQSTKLDYDPKDIDSPVRLQPLSLGELGVRGAFFRVSLAVTY